MEFEKDVHMPEHSHESQWEIVLEVRVNLNVKEKNKHMQKVTDFLIPKGVMHSRKVHLK